MDSAEDIKHIIPLLQYKHGGLLAKIMFTASELGVFDLLLEPGKLMTSTAIAERLGTSSTGMERLLDACVGLKLLRVERTDNQVLYGNTDFSNLCLAESSPKSQYHHMMFHSEITLMNVRYLTDAVRQGKSPIEKIFGNPSDNFFDGLFRSSSCLAAFFSLTSIPVFPKPGSPAVFALHDSKLEGPVVKDDGNYSLKTAGEPSLGGGGSLAKECISLYPNSTVTILDLPSVVEMAKKHFVSSEEHQITFHEGDFFKDPIPEADLYILARILHDWDDEKCVQLLTKLHKACKPGGGVLVVEKVLNEDKSGPLEAQLSSMLMLLLTEGKERTLSEYNALLSAAGFKEVQLKKRQLYDAILGRK